MYKVIFYKSKQLEKDRKTINKNLSQKEKIIHIIQKLSLNPFAQSNLDIKKLKNPGESGIFRLRTGDYRILFDVDTHNKIIIIYRIKLRKDEEVTIVLKAANEAKDGKLLKGDLDTLAKLL